MPPRSAAPPWAPLASPGQATRIEAVLDEIADALWAARDAMDPSLVSGLAGAALFFGYLSLRPGRANPSQRAHALLEMAVGAVAKTPHPSLYAGFPGIAWCVEHLGRQGVLADAEDCNADVDAAIQELLDRGPWARRLDLISGLVGLGVYALERLPRARRGLLARILDHLEASAQEWGPGLAWPTPPELLPTWQRELCPNGYLNFGLAHGVPGILALLAAIQGNGIESRRCARLLDGGMAALMEHLQEPEIGTFLPNWCPIRQERPQPCQERVAWCYGDLGASLALHQVAGTARSETWAELARTMARVAAHRPIAESGVIDPGLCHGSAGNAHLFNRWYQETGEEPFRAAAHSYLEQTLEVWPATPGRAPGLALDPRPEPGEDVAPQTPSAGLLSGTAGMGLALLAALGGPAPAWDRILLISSPGPGANVG